MQVLVGCASISSDLLMQIKVEKRNEKSCDRANSFFLCILNDCCVGSLQIGFVFVRTMINHKLEDTTAPKTSFSLSSDADRTK